MTGTSLPSSSRPGSGSRFAGRGAAYVFRMQGNNWNQEDKLIPSDGVSGDRAGSAVDLTDDVALLRSKLVRKGQKMPDGSAMADRHIHHLRVLERREGRWVIVSHLISQAQPKGEPSEQ